MLRRAGFLYRKLKLADSGWHMRDSGALVAVMREDDRAVALLPQRGKGYQVYDPVRKQDYPFEPSMLADMYPSAYMAYAPMCDVM